jgi:hypothetical protein
MQFRPNRFHEVANVLTRSIRSLNTRRFAWFCIAKENNLQEPSSLQQHCSIPFSNAVGEKSIILLNHRNGFLNVMFWSLF